MQLNIKATGLTLTDEVRAYLDKRLHKVSQMVASHNGSAVIEVELERTMSHEAGEVFRGEVTISGDGLSIRAESQEKTLHAAIDVLEDVALVELRKSKGKKLRLFRLQGLRVKNWLRFGKKD